ncbi:MAG: LysE family translocator [Pseudomonadota bacterium]
MTGFEFFLFWIGWCLAGGSPGPATLSIASTAMARGRVFSVAIALGILLGSATWGIAAALGVSAIMLANVWLFEMIRYAGAIYLLWLAYKSFKSALSAKPPQSGRSIAGGVHRVFWKGALIHLTNPKAILSWGAVYAIVLPVGAPISATLATFAFLYGGSVLVFVGYAFLFSTPVLVTAYTRARRWFEGTFALFFGVASLKILTMRIV